MGIGINAGQAVVGNIGSEMRVKYGIVGSAVNITQRIQDQASGGETLISKSVLQHVGNLVEIDHAVRVCLRGIGQPVRLFAVKPIADTLQGSPIRGTTEVSHLRLSSSAS